MSLFRTASYECMISWETGSPHRSKWLEQKAVQAMKDDIGTDDSERYRCGQGARRDGVTAIHPEAAKWQSTHVRWRKSH